MQIYLARNNVQAGPYSLEQLNTMLLSGEVVGSDLMWHEGMDEWQTVAQLTNGKPYQPNGASMPEEKPSGRVSVAQMYGHSHTTNTESTAAPAQQTLPDERVYAGSLKRFGAFLINMVLFYLALFPIQKAMLSSNIDMSQYEGQDFATTFAKSQELAAQMQSSVSSEAIMLSSLLLFGFMIVQLILLVLRGQSLGKLIMGIRIVDENTHKNNAFGNFTRTILLFLIYLLAFYSTNGLLAGVLLSINYFLAGNNPKRQGWHDKITKSVVIDNKRANQS